MSVPVFCKECGERISQGIVCANCWSGMEKASETVRKRPIITAAIPLASKPPAPTVGETSFADKMRLRMKACGVCHGTMQWQPPDMSEPAACLECFDWNKAINEVERLQRDLATLTRQRDGLKKALEEVVRVHSASNNTIWSTDSAAISQAKAVLTNKG